jgi:mannitol/fructose-specific phosphotransferase system IIA component
MHPGAQRLEVERYRGHILLGQTPRSKEEVLWKIGQTLVGAADVTPRWAVALLEKELREASFLTGDIVLAEAAPEFNREIARTAFVLVQAPRGVDWGNGKIVRLAIGLAGKGDQAHLDLLGALAGVLARRAAVRRLLKATNPTEAARILDSCAG